MNRVACEGRWLHLTRVALPAVAVARGWPIRLDHCFQRVLLDAIFDDVWYAHVPRRPAYRHLSDDRLGAAVALAEAVLAGTSDLPALDARSLGYRRAAKAGEAR